MTPRAFQLAPFFPPAGPLAARRAGFRLGGGGAHASRTIMLEELSALFEATEPGAPREAYIHAIVEENCLAKATVTTRRKTSKLLTELYALDPGVAAFRVLRHLWPLDTAERPRLALLLALARDSLLRATAPVILAMGESEELPRAELRTALRSAVGERLNDAILDKVARNAASSWTQSGHLAGRTFKTRRHVGLGYIPVAYALWLAQAAGYRGSELLGSAWVAVLDCSTAQALDQAREAKRHGLLDLTAAGNVLDLNLDRLDPLAGRRRS